MRSGTSLGRGAEENGSAGIFVAVIGDGHGTSATLADARVKSVFDHDLRGRNVRIFHGAVEFTNR